MLLYLIGLSVCVRMWNVMANLVEAAATSTTATVTIRTIMAVFQVYSTVDLVIPWHLQPQQNVKKRSRPVLCRRRLSQHFLQSVWHCSSSSMTTCCRMLSAIASPYICRMLYHSGDVLCPTNITTRSVHCFHCELSCKLWTVQIF